MGYPSRMTDTLLARAELHGLMLGLWCDAGRRWYVECDDLATGDAYRHVEVRGTREAGFALYGRLVERMSDPAEHPARPDGQWWLIENNTEEAT